MYKTVLLLLLIVKLSIAAGQSNWKLGAEKNGIKVYTAHVPDSKIKAIKVECEVKARASQLIAVMLDINASQEWIYRTKNYKLLKQVSPSELYYYCEVIIPWP